MNPEDAERSNFLTGEVKKVHYERRNGRTATFEWRIPDFSHRRLQMQSPSVAYFDMWWYLSIDKTGNGVDYIWLNRDPVTPGILETVHFSIQCKTTHGEKRYIARDQGISRGKPWWEQDIDPPYKVLSSDELIFTCALWEFDSSNARGICRETQTEDTGNKGVSRETQTEDADDQNKDHPLEGICRETQTEDIDNKDFSNLSEEFKKLLLSGTDHDVLLKVGDKQFRAHKCVLQARSTVFAAMFSNKMAESADGSVTIEDCDPDAFGQFLQFVYSGEVDIASVSSALGLYYAGDKYDIPRLKEISVSFMKISFTATTVFDVISLAARYDEEELLQQAIVYFANHLEEVLVTVEWQRFFLAHPIQANEMYLKVAQCLKTSL